MKKRIFIILTVVVICLLVIAGLVYAQDNEGDGDKNVVVQKKGIITLILDNVLALTIIIIFFTALLNTFIKQRSRDKCLKDFKDNYVTFKLKNGKAIWGRLKLYSTDVELMYKNAFYDDTDGHYEYSYIMSEAELDANIHAIHRYHWDLTHKNKKKREKSIKRSYNPNIFRRFGRGFRNVVNTFKDAFNKSLKLFIGQFGSKIAGGKANKEITSVGSSILGSMGNAYDSILEKYIGKIVIAELKTNGTIKEYEGILKEYTAKYIELLNLKYDFDFRISLSKIPANEEFSKIKLKKIDNTLQIYNPTPTEIILEKIMENDKVVSEINKTIGTNEKFELKLDDYGDDYKKLELNFITERFVDIIAPRSLLTIRHCGKTEKPSFSEIIGLDDISLSFINEEKQQSKKKKK